MGSALYLPRDVVLHNEHGLVGKRVHVSMIEPLEYIGIGTYIGEVKIFRWYNILGELAIEYLSPNLVYTPPTYKLGPDTDPEQIIKMDNGLFLFGTNFSVTEVKPYAQ